MAITTCKNARVNEPLQLLSIMTFSLLYANKVDELLGETGMKHTAAPWKGVISYKKSKKSKKSQEVKEIKVDIESPSEVGAAVEKATARLTKGAKEISDSLIHLEVQSQTVPDLTLIDLPGIARVAVEGQNTNVPEQIKSLIKKYVKKEETIILAVIPCNVDIATTEALQLAQQVFLIKHFKRMNSLLYLSLYNAYPTWKF